MKRTGPLPFVRRGRWDSRQFLDCFIVRILTRTSLLVRDLLMGSFLPAKMSLSLLHWLEAETINVIRERGFGLLLFALNVSRILVAIALQSERGQPNLYVAGVYLLDARQSPPTVCLGPTSGAVNSGVIGSKYPDRFSVRTTNSS